MGVSEAYATGREVSSATLRGRGTFERGTALRVKFYGVRGSCPCSGPKIARYGGATSCVALWPDGPTSAPVSRAGTGTGAGTYPSSRAGAGAPFILDLGTGVHQLGLDLPRAPIELVAVVSHLHFDHIQGLPFFPAALVEGSVIDIYGPVPEEGSLAEGFTSVLRPPWFPLPLEELPAELRFHELDEGDLHVGGFELRARRVPHLGATCGYRIERDGVKVAYVSDHQAPFTRDAVSDAVLDLCDGADLVIHDAQYTEAEFEAKKHWGHSTVGYAVRVAHEAGARRLALYHHDPTHGDDELDRLGDEARQLARRTGAGDLEVIVAAEGLTVDLACPPLPPKSGR